MQVKKYEAASVLEALQQVKKDLGPDAIILKTQELKRVPGAPKKFLVVGAVTDNQLRKKEIAEQQLGDVFTNKVQGQSAIKQKMFIENHFNNLERQHTAKNHQVTSTPYIDIADDGEEAVSAAEAPKPAAPADSGVRVKEAAKAAFQSSLVSDLFGEKRPQPSNVILSAAKDLAARKPELPQSIAAMLQRLGQSGVSTEILNQMKMQSLGELGRNASRKAIVDSWFAKWIMNRVQIEQTPTQEKYEFFVGAHGAGKTSALVKLATNYVVNQRKTLAIVTTDTQKVGAVDQLKVYGRILNAPVFVCSSLQEIPQTLKALSGFDRVLIDTPAVSLSNIEELDQMRGIAQLGSGPNARIHFVISALTKALDLPGLIKRFRVSQFKDVIVTNIDQTALHGVLLNIQESVHAPFHSFGIGSDVVDGFEFASRERVLDLLFKLTKPIGEKANDSRI